MVVEELITQLEALPKDAWVDAMFPNDGAAYAVQGATPLTLNDGRVIAVIDIYDDVPLRAV